MENNQKFHNQELLVVSNHALQEIKGLNANARYLRLKITEGTAVNGTVWCYSIWDLRVFGQEISLAEEHTIPFSTELYDPQTTSDRGLEVTLSSSDESIAKVVNNKIQLLKTGVVEIEATQSGNRNSGNTLPNFND